MKCNNRYIMYIPANMKCFIKRIVCIYTVYHMPIDFKFNNFSYHYYVKVKIKWTYYKVTRTDVANSVVMI